jgi:glycosyltransferase involved in cell wall biosynthesis
VCLEAGAAGVPIALFDQGGIPRLVRDADGGVLAPPGDVDELARQVLRLVEDDEGRRAAGRRLAQHVRTHHDAAAGARSIVDELRRHLR